MTKHIYQRCSFTMILCVFALMPSTLFAWSQEAHRAIAIIAADRLQGTKAAQRISSLLGSLTLADIAVCPDEIRELERHQISALSAPCEKIFPNHPTGTSDWHFVNTPIKGDDFTPTAADIAAVCTKPCATTQITHFLAVLSASKRTDKGAKKRADQQALAFVVHFIGDIHQPLHSADRDGDNGGNSEHVKFFNADKVPLHSIWDNQIVARIDKTETELASDLAPDIATAAGEPQATPIDWALQAYLPARDVAYKGIPPADDGNDVAELAQPYQDSAAPIVRQQVSRAGVRLAAALSSALGSGPQAKKSAHKKKIS